MSKFIENLINLLNEKKLSANSIKLYIKNLERLNGGKPFNNLAFLSNYENVETILNKYKPNTQRNFYIAICSVLGLFKDKSKKDKLIHEHYFNKMMDMNQSLKKIEKDGVKSDTQSKNWMTWDDVQSKFKELYDMVVTFDKKAKLTKAQYNTLLECVVLGLYVLLPPRRNDYHLMNVVKKYSDGLSNDRNYLDLDNKQFIFNNFKTAKKEGKQQIKIPNDLMNLINIYIKYHPLKREKKNNYQFLVNYEGKPLDKINSITLLLNRIFDKNIGSSMLRHIYLSSKYSDVSKEKVKDAKMMSHSVDMQNDYIKK